MNTRDINIMHRDLVVRAVVGTRPAILAKEADTVALDRICQRLTDSEEAIKLLCANGYGLPSRSLPDMVRALISRAACA